MSTTTYMAIKSRDQRRRQVDDLRPTQVVPFNQTRARDRLLDYIAAMVNTHILIGGYKL
jgi:hypothetical protein